MDTDRASQDGPVKAPAVNNTSGAVAFDYLGVLEEGPSLHQPWVTRASLVLTCWGLVTLAVAVCVLVLHRRLHHSRRALLTTNLLLHLLLTSVCDHIPSIYYEHNRRTGWVNMGEGYCKLYILAGTLTSFTLPWSMVVNTVDAVVLMMNPEKYSRRMTLVAFAGLALGPWVIAGAVTALTVLHDMPGIGGVEFKICTTTLTLTTWVRHDIVVMSLGFVIPDVIVIIVTTLTAMHGCRALRAMDTSGSGRQHLAVIMGTTIATNALYLPSRCLWFFCWVATHAILTTSSAGDDVVGDYAGDVTPGADVTARDATHLISHLYYANLAVLWCIQQPEVTLPVLTWIQERLSPRPHQQEPELNMEEITITETN